jgi:hypothetical protein
MFFVAGIALLAIPARLLFATSAQVCDRAKFVKIVQDLFSEER